MAHGEQRAPLSTARQIEKAIAIDGKQTEHRVAGVPGLTLVVSPSGAASFYIRYRVGHGRDGRKFRRQRLGSRDLLTLHDAREMAMQIMQDVAKGADPVQEAADKANALSLQELFEERAKADVSRAKSTMASYKRALEIDVFPALGDVPAAELTASQIADVLRPIRERSPHSAHRARVAIGSTFSWAVRERLVDVNPTTGLGFTYAAPPRHREYSDDDIALIWKGASDGRGMSVAMRTIIQLAILTGQRMETIVGARQAELQELDGAAPRWVIPGTRIEAGKRMEGRMKSKKPHVLPLVPPVADLFREAVMAAGGKCKFVFPADVSRVRLGKEPKVPHIRIDSATTAMARLRERVGIADARLHDMRKVIASWLGERLVDERVIQAILHHAPGDVTSSHYNHARLEVPVRAALRTWADHVWQITGQGAVGGDDVVVPLRA